MIGLMRGGEIAFAMKRFSGWAGAILTFSLMIGAVPKSLLAEETGDPDRVVDQSYLSGLKFRMVGPVRGGRVTAVTGVPASPHLFYFGSTGGGVWRSNDAGETWVNLSDGQIGAGSIGAVAVAPSDPNVIYVGTGSACIRGNVSPGIGVFRSTDAGKTWESRGIPNAGQIGKIRVHPKDPDLVYVAVLGNVFGPSEERGVYRSRDGGATWEKVLYIDERTGVVDLVMSPANPRILFAAAWNGERKPWTLISGSEKCGVYKSKDGGTSWEKVAGGLPEGVVGKVGLAISPARPERVWALVEAESGGFFRSDDSGATWKIISDQAGIRQRPWYYTHVTADPRDENTVWISNVMLYKSVDGGKSFSIVRVPHGDNHDLWINPDNSDIMINGDDGGASVTLNGGRSWSSLRNQPTAEIYRLTVDNQFPYRLYGAQQDNSTISVPSRVPPEMLSETEAEFEVGGCESGHIAVDPTDPNVIYAGCYGGSITRMDRRTGKTREIIADPQLQLGQLRSGLRYRFQWNAPIRISPHDSRVLYHAAQMILRSKDEGRTWEEISPDLTTNNPDHQGYAGGPLTRDGTGVEVFGTVFSFEESSHEAGVLWAGSDDGRLHVSRNNGGSWTEVTPRELPPGTTINSIEISPHSPSRVLFAAHRYRESDFRPFIFVTDDYGATWKSLADGSNGIPGDHFVRVVREDPDRKGLLYAGTEFGLYVSFDEGAHWQAFQLNLPVSPVTDLAVYRKDLVVSTQGRSFWILDDLTPLHQWADGLPKVPARLLGPRPAYRISGGGFGSSGEGNGVQAPPAGAILYYWLNEKPDQEVVLEIADSQGKLVQKFSSEKKEAGQPGPLEQAAEAFGINIGPPLLPKEAGLNRFSWDLRYEKPGTPAGAVIFGMIRGPLAPPGDFQLTLTIGEWKETRTLRVLADPQDPSSQADLESQFRFLQSVGTTITELSRRVEELRSVRDQVEAAIGRLEQSGVEEETVKKAKKAGDSLAEKLKAVEEELVQTKSRGFQDPLNYPGRLYDQLAHVLSIVSRSDAGQPTPGTVKRFEELTRALAAVYEQLDSAFKADLGEFNRLVGRLELPTVIVPKRREM